jgi:hypothetical protein
MINTNELTLKLREYVNYQITSLGKTNPMVSFIKPLITRVVDKNFNKVNKALNLIADDNGNIDIENIIEEMIQSVMNTEPFTFNTSFAGDIEIGGGLIKINIPLTDKRLILNKVDIQNFKSMLTSK